MLREELIKKGFTITQIANEIEVRVQDLSHYLRGQEKKVGRAAWEAIHQWMVVNGFETEEQAPKTCICSRCKNAHIPGNRNSGEKDSMADSAKAASRKQSELPENEPSRVNGLTLDQRRWSKYHSSIDSLKH